MEGEGLGRIETRRGQRHVRCPRYARYSAWILVFLVIILAAPPVGAAGPTQLLSSRNWAGYAVEAKDVTLIHSAWKVPSVAPTADAFSSSWIGIGGASSDTLIQAGTTQYIENGVAKYFAWIEMLPQPADLIAPGTLRIRPGDAVGVTIRSMGGNDWQVKFENASSGQQFTRTVTYASCTCSAEWIEEEPTVITDTSQGLTPLANFGAVTFSDAYAKVGAKTQSLRQLSVTPITLKNGQGQVLASSGDLSPSGNHFTITYGH